MTDTTTNRAWTITITDEARRPLTPDLIEWELRGLRPVTVTAHVGGPWPVAGLDWVAPTLPVVKVQVFRGYYKNTEAETYLALVKMPLDREDGGGLHPQHVPAFLAVVARAQQIADDMNAAFAAEWVWERDEVAGLPGWVLVSHRSEGVRASITDAAIRGACREVVEEKYLRGLPRLPDEVWAIADLAGVLAGER